MEHRVHRCCAWTLIGFVVWLVSAAVPAHAVEYWSPYGTDNSRCGQVGCVDGLTLRVFPSYHWPPGQYRFEFDTDGKTITCKSQLPFRSCVAITNILCTDDRVVIAQAGCAAAEESQGFGDILVVPGPEHIHVRVFLDDHMIADKDFKPTYLMTHPNGKQCEPHCREASVRLF